MIARVFDDNDWATYYCTLCCRPFKALQEANEHGGFCGRDKPIQPTFRSVTTAATFELKDDDTQFYTNEARTWQGLTDEEIDAIWGSWMRPYAQMVSAKLKEKNT